MQKVYTKIESIVGNVVTVRASGVRNGDLALVGDSYAKDIVPAKAAGCHTVWMRGEGWTDDEAADTSAADFTIHRLAELL